ncbi:MAG: hypothetical protein PWP07_556 [Epulopiscium sp.]|jgi:hypothetical protein|nr:hypothetical protein [Candidatus Epulonipiscium sp.]
MVVLDVFSDFFKVVWSGWMIKCNPIQLLVIAIICNSKNMVLYKLDRIENKLQGDML